MLFSNAYVFQGEEGFVRGSLRVENGKITAELVNDVYLANLLGLDGSLTPRS